MSQRTDRIDELLRQEIGQALEREVADPALGFVTVTDVETTPDLSHARVWVSMIGDEEHRKATLAALRRAMPYVRHGLGAKLRLRRIPQLDVRVDTSVERGTRVLRLLDELEAGHVPAGDGGVGESLPTPVARLPHEGDAPEPLAGSGSLDGSPAIPLDAASPVRAPRRHDRDRKGRDARDARGRRRS